MNKWNEDKNKANGGRNVRKPSPVTSKAIVDSGRDRGWINAFGEE